jgi:hypothetical protein
MACMFSILRLIVTSNVIRVLPYKKAYQISMFLPVTTFMPLYQIQNQNSESLKESELTTLGAILTARPEEDNKFTYNSTGQKNANVVGLCIERLSLTDLEELSVLIPKIFQSSLHNWGSALGLNPSGFPEYMETYLSEPLLIEELGCFGVRSETSGRFIGALVLENGPPLEAKEKEKEKEKMDEKEDESSETG